MKNSAALTHLALKMICTLTAAMIFTSVGNAALTVRGENEEAVIALNQDVNVWVMKQEKSECAKGANILESAKEFAQSPTLTPEQKSDAEKAAATLTAALKSTCDSQESMTASVDSLQTDSTTSKVSSGQKSATKSESSTN